MVSPLTRPLAPDELATIEDVLLRLKEHFYQWGDYDGFEYDLVEFAFYEGCGGSDHCGAILAEAAPIALGKELVQHHGFNWAAVHQDDEWHFGVTHPSLAAPIDLMTLEDGRYNTDTYDEPPVPGQVTSESLEGILSKVPLGRRWTR